MYKKLKDLREKEAISQKELADMMEVSESCISRWESGKRIPNSRNMVKYYKVFNVTEDYFFNKSASYDNFEKSINLSILNYKGTKKLYDCYCEIIKNEENLKKYWQALKFSI